MSQKINNENIFETFKACLVVSNIALVTLYFTKSPLVAMFLNQCCPKSVGFLP